MQDSLDDSVALEQLSSLSGWLILFAVFIVNRHHNESNDKWV